MANMGPLRMVGMKLSREMHAFTNSIELGGPSFSTLVSLAHKIFPTQRQSLWCLNMSINIIWRTD